MDSTSTDDSTNAKSCEDADFKVVVSKKRRQEWKFLLKKAVGDKCFARNLLENSGLLHTQETERGRFCLTRLRLASFPMNRAIFEKGKLNESKSEGCERPEWKFWYQRYYYYSRFDEGIKMDQESNLDLK